MGHDITAYRPNIDRERLAAELRVTELDHPQWADRYDAYRAATELAYLCRSAGNSLNVVIYLALGVYDEAYGGCSGRGVTIDFNLDQFLNAKAILQRKDFKNVERPRNIVDDLVGMLRNSGVAVIDGQQPFEEADVTPEIEFVGQCIVYLLDHEGESLAVCFD